MKILTTFARPTLCQISTLEENIGKKNFCTSLITGKKRKKQNTKFLRFTEIKKTPFLNKLNFQKSNWYFISIIHGIASQNFLTLLKRRFMNVYYIMSIYISPTYSPSIYISSINSPSIYISSIYSPSIYILSIYSPSIYISSIYSPSIYISSTTTFGQLIQKVNWCISCDYILSTVKNKFTWSTYDQTSNLIIPWFVIQNVGQ